MDNTTEIKIMNELEKMSNRLSEGAKTFANHDVRLHALEVYQTKQNGSLQRLEEKVERCMADINLKLDASREREDRRYREQRKRDDEDRMWTQGWFIKIGVGLLLLLLGMVLQGSM